MSVEISKSGGIISQKLLKRSLQRTSSKARDSIGQKIDTAQVVRRLVNAILISFYLLSNLLVKHNIYSIQHIRRINLFFYFLMN